MTSSGNTSPPGITPTDKGVPRGWLGTAAGVFSLANSNRYCGSYLTIDDAASILQVPADYLQTLLPTVPQGTHLYVSDKRLGRAWASGLIRSPRSQFRRGQAMVSFDELIVLTLIEQSLPDAHVEPQVFVGKNLIDFRLTYRSQRLAIEFLGPYHFIQRSRFKRISDPRVRGATIEGKLHHECVLWPYWVQRCEANVRALFDKSVKGLGSIWSTSALFGDFALNNAASIIQNLNARFNVERPDGVGYFYTDELVVKPVHPIVRRIRQGREPIGRLVPHGSPHPDEYWLPRSLWSIAR
jgi:hypothetical protein